MFVSFFVRANQQSPEIVNRFKNVNQVNQVKERSDDDPATSHLGADMQAFIRSLRPPAGNEEIFVLNEPEPLEKPSVPHEFEGSHLRESLEGLGADFLVRLDVLAISV